MGKIVRASGGSYVAQPNDRVRLMSRADLGRCSYWQRAFADKRKDRRYYELVEDTIREEFNYQYFSIEDEHGQVIAIQPFFLLDQDLVAGVSIRIRLLIDSIRRAWPRFLKMRTLMVGCVAGEGHLDGEESSLGSNAELLAAAVVTHAHDLEARLIVLKEFPAKYREPLRSFLSHGFTRVPSLPMTRLNINYSSFEDYMNRALNSATRRKLRKKFRASAQAPAIEMSVVNDVAPVIHELYPLYLQVYERSKLHFEKLTKEYFCGLGRLMPDKVRFFVWRQEGRPIAFTLCMIEFDALYAEYIGLDYKVALDLHLYHYAVRDMTSWAIAHGYKWLRSSGLNYDPKLHLRHLLDPIDLYVRHTSPIANAVLKRILPIIEPTRYDPTLKKFANYDELWEKS
jgi:hypothetical protein